MAATQASMDEDANTMVLEYMLDFSCVAQVHSSTLQWAVERLASFLMHCKSCRITMSENRMESWAIYKNGSACCATLAYTYYKYIAVAYLIQRYTNIIYMYMLIVYAVSDVLCRPPCFWCIVVSFVNLGFVAACKALYIYTCSICANDAHVR